MNNIERTMNILHFKEADIIPCPDHRLMPGSKFELVQYYVEEIKKIKI